jgi:hypothetical protein
MAMDRAQGSRGFPFVPFNLEVFNTAKLQHWCAAMMIFSKVLWFLKLGDLSPQKKNNLA